MTSVKARLRPLTAQDVDECVRVAGLAFEDDRNTALKARSVVDPYDHKEGMRAGLNHWLQRGPEAIDMTVAVDSGTDELLGWVVWGLRGFNAEVSERKQADRSDTSRQQDAPAKRPPSAEEVKQDSGAQSMRKRLESHTSADLNRWMERLMPPGTKCMFICSIVVNPAHHGKGVGSMLVRKGTRRADEERVFCWVHSSEMGAAFFPRFGFHEVGKLEVDLDAFNSDHVEAPGGHDAQWGLYTFRYFRREPQGSQTERHQLNESSGPASQDN